MSSPETPHPGDEQLWRQFSASLSPPGSAERCPSLVDLAGYLDGRATEDAVEAIEAHLAQCADCLDAVIEVRALMLERLDARRGGVIQSLRWAGRWGLAAAASLAICVVGYRAGQSSFGAGSVSGDDLVTEMTFGVFDPAGGGNDLVELELFEDGELTP